MNENVEQFDPPVEYQVRRLQDLIREIIHCCQDRMVLESEKFGVPQAELRCLMLFDGERYLTVKEIAGKMDVAKSRVTKVIDGLASRGLVVRTDDPGDGRITLVRLTGEGRRRLEGIRSFLRGAHEKILLKMDPDQRRRVLSSLELLRSCMEEVKAGLK